MSLTKLNEESYMAYCQITVKKDGTDSVFTVKETHKFEEGISAAVNTQYELIKHIRGVIVESDSDLNCTPRILITTYAQKNTTTKPCATKNSVRKYADN